MLPVPAAEPVVDRWRQEYDPVAPAGVPAHITLIVPWLAPAEIVEADFRDLESSLAQTKAFDFDLTRVGWFGQRVLWLAPEPVEPFLQLIEMLAERFATPPWEGGFDDLVPHLTVAHASDGKELQPVATELSGHLPLHCRVDEAWVMVGDGVRWSVRRRLPLR